jgi:hypothetical protein
MTELYACPDCGRRYRADKLSVCPGCDVETSNEANQEVNQGLSRDSSSRAALSSEEVADWLSLVDAQNRTTYAVRSIALFLLVTSASALVGAVFYAAYLSALLDCGLDTYCIKSIEGWSNVGPSIAGLGILVSLVIGLSELRASKP